jgi:hypothetical protein
LVFVREAVDGWVLASYSADGKTVGYHAHGTDGIEGLKKHLTEDSFYYALIRIANKKELEHSVNVTFRDVFFVFQGSKVPIMKRGKFVEHQGAVEKRFEPNHAQLIVKDITLLNNDSLLTKSDPKAGSHIIE